ncbi:MAG: 4Fe-4S binding protein [Anaerostipes hadrus]
MHGYRHCRFLYSTETEAIAFRKCRACEIKCPVDYQIKRDQKNGGECIHCMQCVDVCPKQNIHLGSGKKLKGNEIIIILLKLVLFIGVCIFAQNL